MAKTLVIGYGNPLRGDDSFGHRAVEKLKQEVIDNEVQFIDCPQLMPEMAEQVSKADLVLFVDADMDGVAGSIHSRRIIASQKPAADSFAHHLDPCTLLGLAQTLYHRVPEAILMTVTGECFGYGSQLSTEVAKALPGIVQHMKELICENRAQPAHA
jgi:hydrogenase maturation protease